jgi:hypothetical protein
MKKYLAIQVQPSGSSNLEKSVTSTAPTYEVSERWIQEHRTRSGGWTKRALAALGVSWPPPHGWIKLAVGKMLTPQERAVFEGQGRTRQPKQQQLLEEHLDGQP